MGDFRRKLDFLGIPRWLIIFAYLSLVCFLIKTCGISHLGKASGFQLWVLHDTYNKDSAQQGATEIATR